MGSTNKTPNYDLSQFIGSDIPSWLGDYDGDMLKIDTAIKNASDTATGASGSAESAVASATQAQQTANSAKTEAENAGTLAQQASQSASNAQNTANNALSNASSAQATANSAQSMAQTNTNTLSGNVWTGFSPVVSLNSKFTNSTERPFSCNYNSFIGLLAFSGTIYSASGVGNTVTIADNEVLFTLPTSIPRPKATRNLNLMGFIYSAVGGNTQALNYLLSATLDTSGVVRCKGGWTLSEISSQLLFVVDDWF